jgi:hypothetical protein
LCRAHHRELHRHGNEASWWERRDIDPLNVALRLWQQTRPNGKSATIDDRNETVVQTTSNDLRVANP